MKILNLLTLSLLILGVTSLSSCKKEGPEGPAGKDGVDGNANVVSGQGTITNWIWDDPHYLGYLNYEAITEEIINSGAVMVYWMTGDGHIALPYTWYPTDTYSRSYQVFVSPGEVRIRITDSDLDQVPDPGNMTFKVVVIEASGMVQNPNVDYSNYEEVRSTFNIED